MIHQLKTSLEQERDMLQMRLEQARRGFPAGWEDPIRKTESLLAAGSIPRHHIEGIAGLRPDDLSALLRREHDPIMRSDRDRIEHGVAALTEFLASPHSVSSAPNALAETPTSAIIRGRMASVHNEGKLGALIGGLGIGKSEIAKAYAAEHPRTQTKSGVVRIEFTETDSSTTAALTSIYQGLSGEHPQKLRAWEIEAAIGRMKRPGDMLILDECNELGAAVSVIKGLWSDRFKFPMFVIGNYDFKRDVYGKASPFAALANRMLKLEITSTSEADVAAWVTWAGLRGEPLYRAAVAIACRRGPTGGLRTLALLVGECRATFPDVPVSAQMLSKVAAGFGLGIQEKAAGQ